MKLILDGFRTYSTKTEIVLPDEGVNLISGKSGKGKSTIFRAIHWALYGKDKNPYSWSNKKKCMVGLYFENPYLVIIRQKNPERLSVQYDEKKEAIQSEEAQQWIQQKFGSRESWVACNYLMQNTKSTFINGTAAEKLELLEEWCFVPGDNPSEWIDKFTKQKQKYQKIYDSQYLLFQNMKNALEPLPEHLSKDDLNEYTPANNADAQQALIALENEWDSLLQKDTKQELLNDCEKELTTLVSEKNALIAQQWTKEIKAKKQTQLKTKQLYHQLQSELEDIPITEKDETIIASIDSQESWESVIHSQQQKDKLQSKCKLNGWDYNYQTLKQIYEKYKQLEKYYLLVNEYKALQYMDPVPESDILFTEKQINEVVYQQKKYNEFKEIVQKLKIKLSDLGDLQQSIKRFQLIEKAIKPYQLYQKLIQSPVEEDLDVNEDPLLALDELETQIASFDKEISKAQQSIQVHTCPHCSGYLRIVNGKIVISDTAPSTKEELQKLQLEKERYIAKKNWINQTYTAYQKWADMNIDEEDIVWAIDYQSTMYTKDVCDKIVKLIVVEEPVISSTIMVAHNDHWKKVALEHELQGIDLSQTEFTWPFIKIQQQLILLQSIINDYIEPLPWKVNELQTTYSLVKKLQKNKDIQNKLATLDIDTIPETIDKECEEQTKLIGRIEQYIKNEKVLQGKHTSLVNWLKNVSTRPSEEIKKEIDSIRIFIQECHCVIPYLKKKADLEICEQKYKQAEKCMNDLTQIIEKARYLEHTLLERFLVSLNSTLEIITGSIFDDPLTVSFVLFKGERPSVNLSMIYKGSTDQSIAELSGGEISRLELALAISLSLTSPFKYLLLDEAFGPLDEATRERCLETIKTMASHKCVIIIAHNQSEGDYTYTHAIE